MDFIQLSNISYLVAALLMREKKDTNAPFLLIVFLVSALHHFYPTDRVLQRFDGTIANICLLILLPFYLRHKKKSLQYWLSCQVFALSLYFYVSCGDDYTSTQYTVNHSIWHLLSAASVILIISAPSKSEVHQCSVQVEKKCKDILKLNIKNEGKNLV
jgi:hypothetical protein